MMLEEYIGKIREKNKEIKVLEEEIEERKRPFGWRNGTNNWEKLTPQEVGPYNRLKKLKKRLRKLEEEKKMKISIVKDIINSTQKYCNCLVTDMFTEEQYECFSIKDYEAVEGKLIFIDTLIRVDKILSEPAEIKAVCGCDIEE